MIHHTPDLPRRLVAEALGTSFLLAIVVGSGIMGEQLAGGNAAIALMANAIATGAGLAVLIALFGPISGGHFNPAVTLAFAARRELSPSDALGYLGAQFLGAMIGVIAAHIMFGEALIQISATDRSGPAQAFSEGVATFGLLATIFGAIKVRPGATPFLVALYIISAYWFTASTSFANPAVTLARSATDTFAGIALSSVPTFIIAQLAGAAIAAAFIPWLFKEERIA